MWWCYLWTDNALAERFNIRRATGRVVVGRFNDLDDLRAHDDAVGEFAGLHKVLARRQPKAQREWQRHIRPN